MNEFAVRFGPAQGMSGVVSVPVDAETGVRRALLLSNVGMLNRTGPFRLYVELARAVADAGWWALRFDGSGMGDSAPRVDRAEWPDGAKQDVVDAMDFLQKTQGIEQFVLLGLCSGVDSMHEAAMQDPRVHGAVFIDGYAYPTALYFVRRALRVFDVARWMHFVRHRLDRLRRPKRPTASAVVFERVAPSRERFVRDIEGFTRRGARVHFIFTATVDRAYNASRQLRELLGAGADWSRISAARATDADHLFTRVSARKELVVLVQRWMDAVGRPTVHSWSDV